MPNPEEVAMARGRPKTHMQRDRGYLTTIERRIATLEKRQQEAERPNGWLIQEICSLKWAAELMQEDLAAREQELRERVDA
jgi:hypothetical protein